MIASIRGEVLVEGAGWLVVAVGGLGYRVEIAPGRVRAHRGEEVALHTSLIVREDSLTLFGFESPDELEVFGLLVGVSGVGPRSALGVLTALTPRDVAAAVAAEDDKPFRAVSGIGPKTAKLIAVSLAGKMRADAYGAAVSRENGSAQSTTADHVREGLVGLGYTEQQADLAVTEAIAAGAAADDSSLLRAALAILQAPRGLTGNRS